MKKRVVALTDKVVKEAVKLNINSTTSIAAFQPKVPNEIKRK